MFLNRFVSLDVSYFEILDYEVLGLEVSLEGWSSSLDLNGNIYVLRRTFTPAKTNVQVVSYAVSEQILDSHVLILDLSLKQYSKR